jgi:hypothetical protein
MTVPKTTVGGPTPAGPPAADAEGTPAKGGEFDALLEEKEGGRPVKGRAGRPGGLVGAEGGARPTTGAGSARGRSDRGTTGRGGAGSAGTSGAEGQGLPAREAAARHALRNAEPEATAPARTAGDGDDRTADLTRPAHAGWTPPATDAAGPTPAAGAGEAAGASDVAARVERIAEQILQAAEVRLHADGAVEARLQLDLGRLGRLHVALERTAEGRIRVALEPTTAEARDLCRAHGRELADRLEARGLNVQELTVESAGETVLRIERARESTDAAAARPTTTAPETATADRTAGQEPPPQREHSGEDREGGRHRREHEPSAEEEEA